MNWSEALFDRFAQLAEKFFQRRHILFNKGNYFLVLDEVNGEECGKGFRVESTFHFAPGDLENDSSRLLFNGNLSGMLAVPDNARINIFKGGAGPDQGWIASGYGEKEPAPLLQIQAEQNLPFRAGIVFPIGRLKSDLQQFTLADAGQDTTVFDIQFKNYTEKIYWNPLRKKVQLSAGQPLETDAVLVVERVRPGEEIERHILK